MAGGKRAVRRMLLPLKALERLMSTPFGTTFEAFLIGAALSIWPGEISSAIREFASHPLRGQPEYGVWVFLTLLAFWLRHLHLQLKAEAASEAERVREIRSWIDRAPNRLVFDSAVNVTGIYRAFWKELDATRLAISDGASGDERRRDRLAEGLRSLLGCIIDLAHAFNPRVGRPDLGANLMVVVERAPGTEGFSSALRALMRFHPAARLGELRGALYLPVPLLIRNAQAPAKALEGGFALPLLDLAGGDHRERQILPGAPLCLRTERANAYLDTERLEGDLGALDKATMTSIQAYFAGEGRHIRSFASYPVGGNTRAAGGTTTEYRVAGVLNLDCAQVELLGPDLDSYTTFEALVAPLTHQLFEPLVRYAALLKATGDPVLQAPAPAGPADS